MAASFLIRDRAPLLDLRSPRNGCRVLKGRCFVSNDLTSLAYVLVIDRLANDCLFLFPIIDWRGLKVCLIL